MEETTPFYVRPTYNQYALNPRPRLAQMLRQFSVKTGKFTLASGKESDLYVDVRQTVMRPGGTMYISRLVIDGLTWLKSTPTRVAFGGMETGAIPLVSSVVDHVFAYVPDAMTPNDHVRGFWVRKEAKGHGVGGRIAGILDPADTVVILEDVATTGTSALAAVRVVREFGATVAGVITVVDREEGASELLATEGIPFAALVTRTELLAKEP